jgi:hypothetical protein
MLNLISYEEFVAAVSRSVKACPAMKELSDEYEQRRGRLIEASRRAPTTDNLFAFLDADAAGHGRTSTTTPAASQEDSSSWSRTP